MDLAIAGLDHCAQRLHLALSLFAAERSRQHHDLEEGAAHGPDVHGRRVNAGAVLAAHVHLGREIERRAALRVDAGLGHAGEYLLG
eukprot:scaffold129674_cov66-Phaeocystis_antarctica.AAC.4